MQCSKSVKVWPNLINANSYWVVNATRHFPKHEAGRKGTLLKPKNQLDTEL